MRRAALGLALLACGLPGCGPGRDEAPAGAPPAPRHIVVLVLDACQAAALGCYGGGADVSPALDALAGSGVVFEAAYSHATWTLPSTASLMSGLLPERHGVARDDDVLDERFATLAERLAGAGWHTTSLVQMPFAGARHGLARGFHEHRGFGPGEGGQWAELRARVDEWVASRGEQPSFLYLHLRRPHTPYDPAPEMLARLGGGAPAPGDRALGFAANDERFLPADGERERLALLYRAGLATIDATIAPWLEELRARGDTLLVVTSDHGEGLGEHGHYGHGRAVWPEHAQVPLIVAGAGVRPGRVAVPVGTVDVHATLVELAGLAAPVASDGESFAAWLVAPATAGGEAARATDERPPITIAGRRYPGESAEVALVDDAWFVRRDAAGAIEVLRRDGGEGPAPGGEQRLRWRTRLEALAGWEPAGPGRAAPLDEAGREALEQLGYLR